MSTRPVRHDLTVVDPPAPGLGRVRLVGFPPGAQWAGWRAALPVATATYQDARAVPLHAGGPNGRQLVGAVYDRQHRLIPDSERGKRNQAWGPNPDRSPPTPGAMDSATPDARGGAALHLPGRTFFAGHRRDIFGHFLLETLPRLWPDLDYGAFDTFLYYPTRLGRQSTAARLPPYAAELLAALGAGTPRGYVMAGRPVLIEELVVTTPAFLLKRAFSPLAREVYQRVAVGLPSAGALPAPDQPLRVYLSRSRLGDRYRCAANEAAIEDIARGRGFRVVHPQELTVSAQVGLVHSADVLAGCDGSALHLAAFARPGTVLVALDSRVVVNQLMLDQLAGLDAIHVLVCTGEVAGRRARWHADLERVRLAFDLALGH